MSRPKKNFLRRFFIWLGPLLVLLVLTVSGFLYWLLSTETGAQWLIRTAAHQLDGESRDIRGNIWEGLQVGSFEANLPDTSISLSNLALRVDWKALWNSQLHVHELSVDRLSLRLDGESEPDGEPFKMPALPVSIQIDRLALGELNLVQQGEPLPITVADLVGDLTLGDNQGIAHIHHLDVGYEEIHAQAQATVVLDAFEAPWPMSAELQVKAYGTNADSMLCADRYLPGLNVSTPKEVVPSGPASTPASASATPPLETGQGEADFAELEQLIEETNTDEQYCAFSLQTTVQGSLDSLQVALAGEGQGISINGKLNAAPTAAFPLRDTQIAIRLGEDTALEVDLDWAQEIIDGTAFDRVRGSLHSKNINVGALLADESLPAVISADGTYDVLLSEGFTPRTLKLDLDIAEPTSWNQQTLAGHARVDLDLHEVEAGVPFWLGYILNDSDVSLRLGSNLVELKGKLGQSDDQLTINIDAPALAQVSEALSEIGALNAGGTVSGSILRHVVDLNVEYALTPENTGTVGEGKVEAAVQASGEFRPASDSQPAQWKGSVSELVVNHAGIAVAALGPFDLSLALPTPDKGLSLSVAPLRLQTSLDNQNWFVLDHGGSSYDDEGWQTQGSIDPIAIAPARIALLRKKLGMDEVQEQQGGVKDRRTAPAPLADLVIGLDWNLSFKQALAGTLNVKRISGDIMVPAEPAFPLGLNDLFLTVKITPGSGSNSQVNASLVAETQEMGRIEGKVESILRYSADRSFHVLESDIIQANLKADIDDLGWTSLFLGDAMELGGTLDADLNLELRTNGDFTSQGHIRGDNLRLTRLDDGIRLLDGTLEARLDNDVFVLDRLYFPAVLRVEPKEWRTATWVSEDPDAQGGSLTLTGQWNLRESTGQFVADLHRYPILQRADRYAMVTGKLNANIVLPHIALSGKIVADAGWFNLDMLGGIPTIDGDIVILRAGETLNDDDVEAPTDITIDLDLDLGRRFYLTGYGVNSGLVGQLRVSMADGALTGVGALSTRGGAIEQYGQRLQLRRGTITFQGDIANPILDIEALRTGLAVQAGVKVVGTARKPKIDLVSYPDVDHVEKLSWLLFGHGSDDSSGDMALLFSVGSSFLGGDEPFYRQFGIDEVAMRSGELGSAGSILPVESTVSGLDASTSDVERQFLQITKQISADITLSAQQALSDTGTVGRASYRLARGLTAEVSAGTVNGLALIYRWFSRDE